MTIRVIRLLFPLIGTHSFPPTRFSSQRAFVGPEPLRGFGGLFRRPFTFQSSAWDRA